MKAFAFIDASNLFYGGEKSLGWKIDYKKLLGYLKDKYEVEDVFYFGGVEMAFHLMKEKDNFTRVIVLSGDGDFLPVLKYLREFGKEVIILGRGSRTAKEIRQFAGSDFKDFEYLRERLRMV